MYTGLPTNSQIFHRVNLPWQINRSRRVHDGAVLREKKKKEGKEEINATYGVIVRVIALLFSFNFLPRLFPTRPIEPRSNSFHRRKRKREILPRSRERERRERQEKCDRDEIICEFGLCRW